MGARGCVNGRSGSIEGVPGGRVDASVHWVGEGGRPNGP